MYSIYFDMKSRNLCSFYPINQENARFEGNLNTNKKLIT